MKSTLAIDVDAPPALVFALARDVSRWADLLPHYVRSREIAVEAPDRRLVEFVARRQLPLLPGAGLLVAWRAVTWAEPTDCRLRFIHRGGATGGMDVTWRIEPGVRDGARVSIEHVFAAPAAWTWFIDRFFTRAIATRTLRTFRAIAEAVATSNLPADANELP